MTDKQCEVILSTVIKGRMTVTRDKGGGEEVIRHNVSVLQDVKSLGSIHNMMSIQQTILH